MQTKQKQDPKHKLEDLEVHEVSVVDRPANLRPFLIVKNHDGVILQLEENMGLQDEVLDLLGLEDSGETESVEIETTVTEKSVEDLIQQLSLSAESFSKAEGEQDSESVAVLLDVAEAAEALSKAKAGEADIEPEEIETESVQDTVAKSLEILMGVSGGGGDIKVASGLATVASLINKSFSTENPDNQQAVEKEAAEIQNKIELVSVEHDGDDQVLVIKRGAKMRKTRLRQFKEAVDMLQSIIKELEDSVQEITTKETTDMAETEKAPALKLEDALAAGFEKLETQLSEQFSKEIAPVREQLESLGKRVEGIENEGTSGNGDVDATELETTKKNHKSGLWSNFFTGLR